MEAEASVLDDYVLSLAPAREPRDLPAADRGRRLRGADPALPDRVRRPPVRAERDLAVPARPRAGAAARAPARAGRHLRRRRLDDQPARAVARARARRDPARGVAGRDRAGRAERGLDVLVRGRHHQGARAAPARPPGLGFLPGSNSVHYDGEPDRRPAFLDAIASGALPAGYGVDDGVGLLFRGTRLAEVVAAREGVRAYRVDAVEGAAREHELEPRVLAGREHTPPGRRAARHRRAAAPPRGTATDGGRLARAAPVRRAVALGWCGSPA